MKIDVKQNVLDQIYGIYDKFTRTIKVACKPGCAACCTQNVTATSNEVYRVVKDLASDNKLDWKKKLTGLVKARYAPVITTNQMAEQCMTGAAIPPEENHAVQDSCPFLQDDLCTIYSHRPFGCRCFVSKQDCRQSDCADVDPFVLTVNTVFLQFIEHIDTPGFTGNFMDCTDIFFRRRKWQSICGQYCRSVGNIFDTKPVHPHPAGAAGAPGENPAHFVRPSGHSNT